MKTKLFIVAFLCCCLCSCNKDHSDSTEKVYDFPLTRQDALEIVSPITDTCKVVMAGKTIFAPSSLILSVPGVEKLYSPDCQTWMIIADTDPGVEGGNHYRYLFVDINTGKVVNTLQAWLPDFFLDKIKWMGKNIVQDGTLSKVIVKPHKTPFFSRREQMGNSNLRWI